MTQSNFVVLAPVKPFTRGKSRLVGMTPGRRRALAEAFAHDTLTAVLGSERVAQVVVMGDEQSLGVNLPECLVVADPVTDDLNASLRALALTASVRWPGLRPVALCGDLPALTADVLTAGLESALARARHGAAFVPDRDGSGTTLYTAPSALFRPRFGSGSRQAHLDDGAVELVVDDRLRQDVDVPADLARVTALGVGVRTAGLLVRS